MKTQSVIPLSVGVLAAILLLEAWLHRYQLVTTSSSGVVRMDRWTGRTERQLVPERSAQIGQAQPVEVAEDWRKCTAEEMHGVRVVSTQWSFENGQTLRVFVINNLNDQVLAGRCEIRWPTDVRLMRSDHVIKIEPQRHGVLEFTVAAPVEKMPEIILHDVMVRR